MLASKSKSQTNTMLTILVNESSKNINANSTESEQATCCFELSQNLLNKLVYYDLDSKQPALNFEQEERLRSELAFVHIPAGPYKSISFFWQSLVVIILGIIFGMGIAEGLGLKGAYAIIGAGLGASLSVWIKSRLEHMKNSATKLVIFSKSLSYKSLCRIFKILILTTIALLILRDFFQLNSFLQIWFSSLKTFFLQGSSLALWSNLYNVVIMLVIFSLSLKQKAELDVKEFKNRLFLASSTWWTVSIRLRGMMIDTKSNKINEEQLTLGNIVKDIYLFANELSPTQQKWLVEHLNQLNLTISQPLGQLLWNDDLAAEYEAIGYLNDGDPCYVDAPAIWKDEKLITKGSIRKIR